MSTPFHTSHQALRIGKWVKSNLDLPSWSLHSTGKEDNNHTCKCEQKKQYLRCREAGFPGGSMVKNSPVNAGDTGSIPGLGRSHMPWSNYAHVTTTEAHDPRASASQPEKPWQWETHTPQLEKCSRSSEDPAQQINTQIHLFFLNAENPRYPVLQEVTGGNSLAVQWLRLSTSTAESLGLIPGQGTKIPHAVGQLSPRATTTKTQSSQKTTTNNKNPRWVGGLTPTYLAFSPTPCTF